MLTRITPVLAMITLMMCLVATAQRTDASLFFSDDFESRTLGDINGQGGWTSTSGNVVQGTESLPIGGQALKVTNVGPTIHTGIFDSTGPVQTLTFDIRLEDDLTSFVGTPLVDIQHTISLRGPSANEEVFFVYKGLTDGAGAVFQNRFEFRGQGGTASSPTPVQDVWYSVEIIYDSDANTADLLMRQGGDVFWDPGTITFFNTGNTNSISLFADSGSDVDYFIDNLTVWVPEPTTATLLAPLFMLITRRRLRA